MKGFTTLMKIAIMCVTIALVAMLVVSAAPLVMGGVNIEKKQEISIENTGATLRITGEYDIVSEMDSEINGLLVEAYLQSRDGGERKMLVSVGPVDVTKDKPCKLVLDETLQIADLALFFVVDNMNSGKTGLELPVTLHIKGTYNGNLAAIDLKTVVNYPISDTGSISIDPSKTEKASDDHVSKAEIKVSGVDMASAIGDIIPDDGAEFTVTIGGKELNLDVSKAGDDIALDIATGDLNADSIKAVVDEILKAVGDKSDDEISFTFTAGTDTPVDVTFRPSDVDSLDPETAEKAQAYIDQLKEISSTLDLFLDKFDKMAGGA